MEVRAVSAELVLGPYGNASHVGISSAGEVGVDASGSTPLSAREVTGIFHDEIWTETINLFHASHRTAAAWQYLSLANGCGWI